ncbi:hypothetical protein FSP39_007074 [Pinctada imbricata]|uniref:beta-N-acetylhexosaminidase n=1 Tax=Pinctada imbricata TaxID=66713 RepID=A0AA88XYD3_PINIB|nr:hypothetical protein FSP39_007074 [Pinctada imbricata]
MSSDTSVPATKNAIVLSLGTMNTDNEDGYVLQVDSSSETITITGRNSSGVFYGMQSLLSLLSGGTGMQVPAVSIVDEPRFQYRGMCVDVARNFQEKSTILKLLDAMAMYKMDRLHLRLADDEGWRLEIPDLPELTEVGGKRCHDLTEDRCLISQLGSGADTTTHGSGFYTVADYQEIVRYAQQRHIEVIPELDSPGHGRAAIIAMEARYRKYNQTNMKMATQYRLVDPNDTSVYQSVQIFNDNAINPCIESTYKFFEKVITEIVKMQPSVKIFHFGGDEVPSGAWVNSSRCEAVAAADPYYKDPKHLKEYFTRRLSNITNELGLNMAGWEDGLMNEDGRPYNRTLLDNTNVYGYAWQNVWEWGNARRAYDLANKDYKASFSFVVMSHATHLYFDHPYEPDPFERGLYWAPRFTDSYKTFRFMPDSLYENIDVRRSGIPISRHQVCKENDRECPPLMHAENIVGIQGQLFSETILTEEYFDYMIFPRILALAERSWHKAPWESTMDKAVRMSQMDEDWKYFTNTVGHKELQRLTKLGIHYRVAPPGAMIEDNIVRAKTEFPGLDVQYSDDDGRTWTDLPHDWHYTPGETIQLRALIVHSSLVDPLYCLVEERIHIPYQSEIDSLANHLDTTFEVVDNLVNDAKNYSCRYTFKNIGSSTVTYGNWSIYFHNIRLVQADDFPYPDGVPMDNCHMRIFHVGGSLYNFSPMKSFSLGPMQTASCLVYAKYWQVARTDTMPNWYITAEGMGPTVVKTTKGNSLSFVKPFVRQGQVQRYPEDRYGFYLPRTRFTYNEGVMKRTRIQKPVIPTPVQMAISSSESLEVNEGWQIVGSELFPKTSQYLADLFNISTNSNQSTNVIRFLKEDVSVLGNKSFTDHEAYILDVRAGVIEITASHEAGAFYAIQTLRQLLTTTNNGYDIPEVNIRDQPRFEYRGMHVDVGRNFKSKVEILKLLDAMALYKLNKFHFHFTEDEGWRIEIPGLEELTMIGSKRCHDPFENRCTLPQLGSDPNDGSSGTGYYTVDEYREILKYANDRNIQVIPEIDMPGHCRAGIKAMEARYRQYLNYGNKTAAEEYLLTELGDPSEYLTVQWFTDNAINPCMDSSYRFIAHVINSLIDMHINIQPLNIFHFGGDEVAHGAWEASNICKEFIKRNAGINSVKDLKKHFGSEVAKLTANKGLDIGAWEDGLWTQVTPHLISVYSLPSQGKIEKVYSYAWSNIWEFGHGDRAYKLANAGYKVVLSHATHLYFDHPYEPDPEERGYYWATRFTDTKKTFGYIPDNIYANADKDRSGKPLTQDQICKEQCLVLQKPENIAGIQGQLWGETVRTDENLDAMIFPRLLALAERAWHKSTWEDIADRETRNIARDEEWEVFSNALGQKHLAILDQFNITYRIPVPGARYVTDLHLPRG